MPSGTVGENQEPAPNLVAPLGDHTGEVGPNVCHGAISRQSGMELPPAVQHTEPADLGMGLTGRRRECLLRA